MNFLQLMYTLTKLIPVLIEIIKSIEDAIPGQGQGEKKLMMVRVLLEQAWAMSDDFSGSFEKLWPGIKAIVATIVSIFNSDGTFEP